MPTGSKEYQAAYRAKHREKRNEYSRTYYEDHKDDLNTYSKDYYEENKDQIRAGQKDYYEENKAKVLEQCREYRSRPEVIEQKKIVAKKYYAENREKILAQSKALRLESKAKVESIALHYGCQNKSCQWSGEYHPSLLDFHHLEDKKKNIAMIYGRKAKIVAAEINKCVVLCSNCHRLLHSTGLVLEGHKRCSVDDQLNVIS